MTRPPYIVHWQEIESPDDAHYPGSDELHSIGAPLGRHTGLTRIGVHHERLPPGRRTSWPHAEADEDELVYVLEGYPHVWIDGVSFALRPGDAVGFPKGTGIAHTFLNDGDRTVRLLAIGEASAKGNRVHYPLHPERNASLGEAHWHDAPARPLGPHDGLPRAPDRTPLAPATQAERRAIPTLETERLVLRAHIPEDATPFYELRCQPGAVDYFSVSPPESLAAAESMMRRYVCQNGWADVGWSIVERERGAFVGMIGILRIDTDNLSAEIGYEIHRAFQRRGYAREAARCAVGYAFSTLGLHRVELRIDPDNTGSIRVAESLGFTLEARLRQNERHPDGRWLDTLVYGRLATDPLRDGTPGAR